LFDSSSKNERREAIIGILAEVSYRLRINLLGVLASEGHPRSWSPTYHFPASSILATSQLGKEVAVKWPVFPFSAASTPSCIFSLPMSWLSVLPVPIGWPKNFVSLGSSYPTPLAFPSTEDSLRGG